MVVRHRGRVGGYVMAGEIIFYQSDDGTIRLETRLDGRLDAAIAQARARARNFRVDGV